jgi:UDP-N-acetylglucosamine 2-epimerase (non-hydrolysing)
LAPDRVIKTGSPMLEVLTTHKAKILKSNVVKKLKLKKGGYFVLSAHREENVDSPKNLNKLVKMLEDVCARYKMPIIFSCHPRTQKRITDSKISPSGVSNVILRSLISRSIALPVATDLVTDATS